MHLGWRWARAGAQRGVLLCVFAVVVLLTTVLTGMVRYLSSSQVAGVREALTEAPAGGRAMQIATGLSDDAVGQSSAADTLLDSIFRALPVEIYRSKAAAPVAIAGSTADAALSLQVVDDLTGHARVVDGSWPLTLVGTVQLALPRDSATALGLKVGDMLTLNGATALRCRVAAIYVPDDQSDPFFFDGAALDPSAAGRSGLIAHEGVIGAADLNRLTASPQVRWTVAPDPRSITPGDVGAVQVAIAGLPRQFNNDAVIDVRGVQRFGTVSDTLAGLAERLAAVRAVSPIPLSVMLILGIFLTVLLTGLLVGVRREDWELLRARGWTGWRIAEVTGTEAAVLAIPAAAIGFGVAVAIWPDGGSSWWPPLVATGITVLASIFLTLRDVLRRQAFSSRGRAVVALGAVVVAVVAAIVSVQRFRQLGSPIALDHNGVAVLDPVAVLAPALVLTATGLIGTALTGAALVAAARISSRAKGFTTTITLRRLARSWAVFGTVTLLGSLAVAVVLTAATFDRTWNDYRSLAARIAGVAPVRVALTDAGDALIGQQAPADGFRALPAVTGAVDALVTPTEVGTAEVELMAAPAGDLARVLPTVGTGFDPVRVGHLLHADWPGLPLPSGRAQLQLQLTVSANPVTKADGAAPNQAGIAFVAWVAGPSGVVIPLDLGEMDLSIPRTAGTTSGASVQRTLAVALPGGTSGRWHLAAIDSVVQPNIRNLRYDVAVGNLSDPKPWMAQSVEEADSQFTTTTGDGQQISWDAPVPASPQSTTIRLMPGSATPAPVPVIVNVELASQLGLTVGSAVDLQLTATDRHVLGHVAEIAEVLPGAPGRPRVLADLGSVLDQLLRTTTTVPTVNQVWLESDAPALTAPAAQSVAGPRAVITVTSATRGDNVVRPASMALWFGGASVAVFAVLALAAVAISQLGERHDEATILQALGVSRRRVTRIRRLELAVAAVAGLVVGAVAGLVAALLTAPGLARAAVVDPPRPTPQIWVSDVVWLLLAAGVAAASAVIVLGTARVGRQARR